MSDFRVIGGGCFVGIGCADGDLILPVEPSTQVDEFATIRTEGEVRTAGISAGGVGEFNGLSADGALEVHRRFRK